MEQGGNPTRPQAQRTKQGCPQLPRAVPPPAAGPHRRASRLACSSRPDCSGRVSGGCAGRCCCTSPCGTSRLLAGAASKVGGGLLTLGPDLACVRLHALSAGVAYTRSRCPPGKLSKHSQPCALPCPCSPSAVPVHLLILPCPPADPTTLSCACLHTTCRHILGGVEYSLELCTASSGLGLGGSRFKLGGFGTVTKANSNQMAADFVNERIRKALAAAHVSSSVMTALQVCDLCCCARVYDNANGLGREKILQGELRAAVLTQRSCWPARYRTSLAGLAFVQACTPSRRQPGCIVCMRVASFCCRCTSAVWWRLPSPTVLLSCRRPAPLCCHSYGQLRTASLWCCASVWTPS